MAGAVFGAALAVRLVHVWQIRDAPFFSVLMGDSHGYDDWARRIAGGEWIGRDVFYQAPLYPYFLGVLYAIAGRSLLLVRIVQAVIGSASCVLVATAARRLFSPRAGLVAGLMMALYAPAIFFDGLVQKSVLDVFFVSLALALLAAVIGNRSPASNPQSIPNPQSPIQNVSLGVAMGALALTRENALVLVAVVLVWILCTRAPGLRSPRRAGPFGPAAAFVLGVALVVGPVAIRNYAVGGGFYVTTSQLGTNFFIGNNPRADGSYASLRYGRGAPEYERQDATQLAEHAEGRTLTPAEVSSYWVGRALDFITGQPGAWLRLMARKTLLLINRSEMVDTESQATHAEWSLPLRLLGPVTNFGLLIPLALAGVIATWHRRRELWVLYAMTIAYAASVVLFYVFARYRFPLVPFLVLFAAAALDFLAGSKRTRPTRIEESPINPQSPIQNPKWLGAAVLAAAALSNWPLLSTDLMRAVTENNLAAALQAERRYDEARAHYERAIALRADYAPAYSNLGTALRAQGRTADAIAAYERALRVQPDYPDAHYNLANALLDEGRADAAADHFKAALAVVPASVETHNNLGIALAAKGRHDEARAEFETAVRLDPASAASERNLGDVLATLGRGREALDHLRRATELAPADAALRYDYGSLLLEAGRPGEAVKEFEAALRVDPQSVEAHNNLGIALASMGRLDEAIAQFEASLRLRPDFADARRNLALALAQKKGLGIRD